MYSRYIAHWQPDHGILFSEPIRERDRHLFQETRCIMCREKFYVAKELKPVPDRCEKCFLAGLGGKGNAVKKESDAVHREPLGT
jgi:hypothetical protein